MGFKEELADETELFGRTLDDVLGVASAADVYVAGGILQNATWQAARTEEEFAGVVGEHLSHEQIAAVMPGAPATIPRTPSTAVAQALEIFRYAHHDGLLVRLD